jgi:hypothetical protein
MPAADNTAEQTTFTRNMRCPLCGKFLWYSHDYLDGRRVDGIRFGPLKDPAAMSQCPKCGGLWFVYERELQFEIVEGDRTTEVAAEQTMTLDNLQGSSPLRRRKEVSQEWNTQLEITVEESSTRQNGIQIGTKDVASFSAIAENALKVNYRTIEESRRKYTETFEFEVPVGVIRTVTFTFQRIWQHGVLRTEAQDGTVVECPYRVISGFELDVKQIDSSVS